MRLPLLLLSATALAVPSLSAADATWAQVKTVLDSRCVSCHGADKQKGGLRLDSAEAIQKGSKDGKVLVPGKPEESPMYALAALPASDDDKMPPRGERLTAAQLTTLKDWITSGASFAAAGGAAAPVTPPPAAKPAATDTAPSPMMAMDDNAPTHPVTPPTLPGAATGAAKPATAPAAPAAPVVVTPAPAIPAGVVDELGQQQILVAVLPGGWLDVNAAHTKGSITNEQLALLVKAAPAVAALNLAGSGLTDRQAPALTAFPNLGRLHLENTPLGDAAMASVAKVTTLTYLNLRNTQVGDGGLATLRPLAHLDELYLWQSKATAAGVAQLRKTLPELVAVLGPDDLPTTKMEAGKGKGKKKK